MLFATILPSSAGLRRCRGIRWISTSSLAMGLHDSVGGNWNVGVAVGVTAVAGIALIATIVISSRRGNLKSPWATRRRKQPLKREHWDRLFTDDGKLWDGEMLLKKIRSGGIEPNIRPLVWPFLLGVYDLASSEDQRNAVRIQRRKAYKILRKKCKLVMETCVNDRGSEEQKVNENDYSECDKLCTDRGNEEQKVNRNDYSECDKLCTNGVKCSSSDSEPTYLSCETGISNGVRENDPLLDNPINSGSCVEAEEKSSLTDVSTPILECASSDSESSVEDLGSMLLYSDAQHCEEDSWLVGKVTPEQVSNKTRKPVEDFVTWQRIIRLDAIRANDEWIPYAPEQAAVSQERAERYAHEVGLIDYSHLETCRIYHAARLVAILEAYATYDPEIGYCQGMSDLLSPILAVMEKDDEAFWCFVGFMKKARHNFRLDEVGIRRQLNIVSKIIRMKDKFLYRHLEKLQAEDCFFVYRMVVVLFRRELNFEQTLCLWEVMWADQAAIRAGIGKSTWARIRLNVPPTDDLLLYAIAASVLQKRKLIIEKYHSMEEIMKECHGMAGRLDIWKLLDDAHELVVTLHNKIS